MKDTNVITPELQKLVKCLIDLTRADLNNGNLYINNRGVKQNLRLLRSIDAKKTYSDNAALRLNFMRDYYILDLEKIYLGKY